MNNARNIKDQSVAKKSLNDLNVYWHFLAVVFRFSDGAIERKRKKGKT